ncbi:MAG: putative Ig domain-containing protein [Acidobacteriota bacterium]|nr:putative Ig domain-containing protein [Acidobacteriota bacterium]
MKKQFLFTVLFVFLAFASSQAATYEVGPNHSLTTIAEVPWATLQPGDMVLIHWRPEPYKEKWVICRQGTAEAPITVRGVPNQNGDLPVIDGNGAVTPRNLNFAAEQRGVIKIGSANVPQDTLPKFIVIENLEIRSAHPNYQFVDDNGATQTYANAASSIYVEKGENISIRNNKLHDSANGFFVASSDSVASRNILVEGNNIFGNGIVNSAFQHNNYTAAINITFQYNRFGPMRAGANGNALKDRSAGLVVRYNWIEHGNRQLDLVEGDDSVLIRNDPSYRKTFVYGNVLIEPNNAGNSQIVHYGGDNGITSLYRKGTLYFYNNTVISTRTGNTTLFRLSTNEETADVRNNIFYVTAAGSNLACLDDTGVLSVWNNWIKPNWRVSHGTANGTVNIQGAFVTSASPLFADEAAQDFRLTMNSPAVNAGTTLNSNALPDNDVVRHYVKHQNSTARAVNGVMDIGAYEFASPTAAMQIITESLPNVRFGKFYNQTLQASGGLGNHVWSVSEGSLPPGFSLDETTGIIRGKAVRRGNWNFQITVRDPNNSQLSATQNFSINIAY